MRKLLLLTGAGLFLLPGAAMAQSVDVNSNVHTDTRSNNGYVRQRIVDTYCVNGYCDRRVVRRNYRDDDGRGYERRRWRNRDGWDDDDRGWRDERRWRDDRRWRGRDRDDDDDDD